MSTEGNKRFATTKSTAALAQKIHKLTFDKRIKLIPKSHNFLNASKIVIAFQSNPEAVNSKHHV